MNEKLSRYEPWLYICAFLLAAAFRLVNLGALALDDREAMEALKALQLTRGTTPVAAQPLYTFFTTGLFAIFGSSNFLARLLPALTGCLLLVVPLYLRDDLGKLPALVLTFGLAIDPAMIALSRQAGSSMPALSLTLLALCFLWKRPGRLAGVIAGLAVLSGAPFWFGLTGILVALLVNSLFRKSGTGGKLPDQLRLDITRFGRHGRDTWLAFGLTLALGGSLFLVFPGGINMIFSGLIEYFRGWYTSSGTSIQRVLTAFVLYQLGILVLGLIEGISGWTQKSALHRFVMLAFLVFLSLLILYPGRQVGYAAWCVVMLWILAAWLLGRLGNISREIVIPILGHAALVGALLLFLVLNIAWILGGFGGLDVTRALAILGGVVIITIISFLVAYGWGIDVATRGVFVGLGLISLSVMLSLSISAGGVNARSEPDFWRHDQRVVGAGILLDDLSTISKWNTGEAFSLSVDVVNFDNPSLHWLLRDFKQTRYLDFLAPGETPDVIITDETSPPELTSSYRGETFVWYSTVNWDTLDAISLLDWLLHRKTDETPANLILWARQDLFVTGD